MQTLQVNGARGEITPLMHARADTEFYQQGYAQCLNTVVTRFGPHTRVPGTLWEGFGKIDASTVKMIPFEFSADQIYAIEFGDGYARFWTPEGQVFSGGSPYEIASPYTAADLQYLHGRQSADTIYLWCNGKRPRILKRTSETSWSFALYKPKDGPYLDMNTSPTTLTLGNTQNVVPKMTSNTTPAPAVANTSVANTDAYLVFSQDKAQYVVLNPSSPNGSIKIDLGVGVGAAMDNYFLIAPDKNAVNDDMPTQWDLRGSVDGTTWITLDSRDGERGWAGSETRYYETNNKRRFRFYRLDVTGGGGSDGQAVSIGGWYMHIGEADQTPTTLTASSTTGINKGAGFRADDVGRPVRLKGSDGRWRWAEITSYISATQVRVVVAGHAFLETQPIQDWAMGAWSDTEGWPNTGTFFEDRLAQAGWASDPIGMALSVSAEYDNFRTSTPNEDDDGIRFRMTGGRFDAVRWLLDTGVLMAGTAGGLRSIGSRDSASVLKNDNLKQRLETTTAVANTQPAPVENAALFIDKTMRRLYELGYNYEADGYLAREISVLNEHLFRVGVAQVAYADAPYCTAFCRRNDGKVVVFTYDKGQKIAGGTLCDFQGVVEDVMVMTGRIYPDVWLVVRRTVNGAVKRCIERLAPYWDGLTDQDAPPIYAACSITYEGAATASISGLLNLVGATVGVWADGQDIGDLTVSPTGVLTLPWAAAQIVAGIRMPFRLVSLKKPDVDARDGSGLNQKLRVVSITADVYETARIYGGGLNETALLRQEDDVNVDPDDPEPLVTGFLKMTIDDSWNNNGVFVIEGDSMYPATVRGVSLEVEMEP